MRIENIQRMAHDILEKGSIENDYIEYKKSATFKNKILKTVCAFANNYMNREIGLLFIGVEEVNDPKTEEKAIPQRPICGVEESLIESTENSLKQLLANIQILAIIKSGFFIHCLNCNRRHRTIMIHKCYSVIININTDIIR